MSGIYECMMRTRLKACENKMRDLQDELDQIVREIKKNPNRSISTDPLAIQKNKEVSVAIQEYLEIKQEFEGRVKII